MTISTYIRRGVSILLTVLLMTSYLTGGLSTARAQQLAWMKSAVIYNVDPEIFSTHGLSGVTTQLGRLHSLGVSIIWLMPIYPRGVECTIGGKDRPAFNSPYCVSNMEAIDPASGTPSDLTELVAKAHRLGMRVILDIALNQTSWDNPLVTSDPQYYLHTDGDPSNVSSIQVGWGRDNDIAQFDLASTENGVRTYLTGVCDYWMSTYHLDGFRVDSADNPYGANRSLPQPFIEEIEKSIRAINPNAILLGEEEEPALALAPYDIDYGWQLQWALVKVMKGTESADTLQAAWQKQESGWPSGMLHMTITQDWDTNADLALYGGPSQAMDAAVFNYTIDGVPLLFNGEEVGNDASGDNTHNQIDWAGPNESTFGQFYRQLIKLRNAHPALQQGSMTWETNSAPGQVCTYLRSGTNSEFLVEVNFNGSAVTGSLSAPNGANWIEVTPSGSPGGKNHQLPSNGNFSLSPYDFAIFESVKTGTTD